MKLGGLKYQFTIFIFLQVLLLNSQEEIYQIDFSTFSNATISGYQEINSAGSEFAPYPLLNGIVYLKADKNEHPYRLEYFNFDSSKVAELSEIISLPSDFHHGPIAYSQSDSTLFFSHNNTNVGKDGKFQMALSHAQLVDGKVSDIVTFEHNGADYSMLHPTLNEYGNVLIFASNMPGGFGKMDLYLSRKIDSSWIAPVNLGPMVNTEENDLFPFFYDNQWLFFSSDGREGHGQLDLYVSQLEQGAFSFAENLGAPLNSPKDDLGLVLLDNQESAFFSSNRKEGQGSDDVYKVDFADSFFNKIEIEENENQEFKKFVVHILDKKSNEGIAGVNLNIIEFAKVKTEVRDLNRVVVIPISHPQPKVISLKSYSDLNGRIELDLAADQNYFLSFYKEGYEAHTLEFDTEKLISEIYIFLDRE